jgi:hypothetical protein
LGTRPLQRRAARGRRHRPRETRGALLVRARPNRAQWSELGAVEGEVRAVKLAGVALDVGMPGESLVVTMPGPLA